jgi:hypothetical protein
MKPSVRKAAYGLFCATPKPFKILIYDMIYLTAIGLTPGGSGTVHIYTQYTE